MSGQDGIRPSDFTRWNYGGLTQASQAEDEAGYTEFGDQEGGCYEGGNSGLGYGFAGKPGMRNQRAPLPMQEDVLPTEVATEVAKNEKVIDAMPGVLVKGEDGSLKKIVTPGVDMPLPDFKPEPTRFDKSVESVLNGRNAAMFINIECKKRMWELEFEEVDQVGPVHDRTYTYSLTIGPQNSEDVIVTCGIAKGKKEAKRRCCEAMVLKVSDLPQAPPLHMQPQFQMQMRGFMRFPGGRGGRFMRGRGGFPPPGFRPRLPPPESEETIFKKYDRTPRGDHPSKNHPISKLCEYIRKHGWPMPQWDLINEKIIQQRKNKHGNANIMLYTYKVTIYPGKGQCEPRVYFGSGPTKKDAKFACGSVAWANIQGGVEPSTEAAAAAAASTAEAKAAGADVDPAAAAVQLDPAVLDPKAAEYNPMQMAVSAISDMNKRVRSGAIKNKDEWLDTVSRNLEQEQKIKKQMELPPDLRPPTQLIKRQDVVKKEEGVEVKTEPKEEAEDGEAEDGEIREESKDRKKKRKSRWETSDEGSAGVKQEPMEEDGEKAYQSRSTSRERSSHKDRDKDRDHKDREDRSRSRHSHERSKSRHSESKDKSRSEARDRDRREDRDRHRDKDRDKDRSRDDRRDRDDRSRSKHDDHYQHDDRSSSGRHHSDRRSHDDKDRRGRDRDRDGHQPRHYEHDTR